MPLIIRIFLKRVFTSFYGVLLCFVTFSDDRSVKHNRGNYTTNANIQINRIARDVYPKIEILHCIPFGPGTENPGKGNDETGIQIDFIRIIRKKGTNASFALSVKNIIEFTNV